MPSPARPRSRAAATSDLGLLDGALLAGRLAVLVASGALGLVTVTLERGNLP